MQSLRIAPPGAPSLVSSLDLGDSFDLADFGSSNAAPPSGRKNKKVAVPSARQILAAANWGIGNVRFAEGILDGNVMYLANELSFDGVNTSGAAVIPVVPDVYAAMRYAVNVADHGFVFADSQDPGRASLYREVSFRLAMAPEIEREGDGDKISTVSMLGATEEELAERGITVQEQAIGRALQTTGYKVLWAHFGAKLSGEDLKGGVAEKQRGITIGGGERGSRTTFAPTGVDPITLIEEATRHHLIRGEFRIAYQRMRADRNAFASWIDARSNMLAYLGLDTEAGLVALLPGSEPKVVAYRDAYMNMCDSVGFTIARIPDDEPAADLSDLGDEDESDTDSETAE